MPLQANSVIFTTYRDRDYYRLRWDFRDDLNETVKIYQECDARWGTHAMECLKLATPDEIEYYFATSGAAKPFGTPQDFFVCAVQYHKRYEWPDSMLPDTPDEE